MDGPNVNWKFVDMLSKQVLDEGNSSFLNIGSCCGVVKFIHYLVLTQRHPLFIYYLLITVLVLVSCCPPHWGFIAAKTLIHENEAVFKILANIMI